MSKTRISVESVRNGPEKVELVVVAWDTQEVEGKPQEVALGEKVLAFKSGTKAADMLADIREAGRQIEEASEQAKEIRAELNQRLQVKAEP